MLLHQRLLMELQSGSLDDCMSKTWIWIYLRKHKLTPFQNFTIKYLNKPRYIIECGSVINTKLCYRYRNPEYL